jgi:signal transduction histidine kinase
MMRTIIGFVIISIITTILTLPAVTFFSRVMVDPYLRTMQRFSTLARCRLSSSELARIETNERRMLEQYASVLHEDMQILADYEKARSWKDGARMLIHELKNPLTPLKLSAQQLAFSSPSIEKEDIDTIITSLDDVENILAMFKNLVNIEFAPKQVVTIPAAIQELLHQLRISGLQFESNIEEISSEFRSYYEPTLCKMLLVNLINNSIEENPQGCELQMFLKENILTIEVLTRDRSIAEPTLVFKAGYSSKGNNRGFGLFLAKLVSEYLDLGITCSNTSAGVIFSIHFKSVISSAQSRDTL